MKSMRTEASSVSAWQTSKGRLQGLRVLVVEDDDDAREAVEQVLEFAGAHVISARTGREGFDAFRRERPDIVVADLWMPDGDGYELIGRIRQLSPSEGGLTPAIATTAVFGARDCLMVGYNALLQKPLDFDSFVEEVHALSRCDGAN